jgi:hypothetical protein
MPPILQISVGHVKENRQFIEGSGKMPRHSIGRGPEPRNLPAA